MLKLNCKGRIKRGEYSPFGQVLLKDDRATSGGYYIYIWPNDGTKWWGSNASMVYDLWFENIEQVERHIANRQWEIEWESDESGHTGT